MSIEKVYDYFHNYDTKVYQIFALVWGMNHQKKIY